MPAGRDPDRTHTRRFSLISDRLQFDRSGKYLLLGHDDHVSIIHGLAPGSDRRTLDVGRRGVRALAGFDDEFWLVADGILVRYSLEGRPIGEPFTLASATGVTGEASWSVAPCGPPGAVWSGNSVVGIIDDLGTLTTHVHADADLHVPLTARRVVAVSGPRVRMPSGITATLAPGTLIRGGMVLADARSVVLASHRELLLLSIGTGHITTRAAVASELVRVAPQRAIAIAQTELDRLAVINLRVGRELGTLVVEQPIDDVAIDPNGHRVAVRSGDSIELIELGDLIAARAVRARGTTPAPIKVHDDEPPQHPVPDDEPAAVIPAAAADPAPARRCAIALDRLAGPLVALAPRRIGPRLGREVALGMLELERDLILARVRVGIAEAWDSRRLGYANESSHPFELEVVALLGQGSGGHAEVHVAAARQQLATTTDARAADRELHFDASPLAELALDFELARLDLEILIAIAAPTLWGETARLYGVLANDPGRAVVDEMLVGQILENTAGRYEIAAALGPDAALRQHGLVVEADHRARPFTHLAINPIIAARLCSQPMPIPDAIRAYEASTPLAELFVPAEPVEQLVEVLAHPSPHPLRLVVRGRLGSGRRSVLAAIAARANRALGLIELGNLSSTDGASTLRSLLQSASLCGLVPCVVGSAAADESNQQRKVLDVVEIIARHRGPVLAVLGSDERSPFPPGHHELVLPRLGASDRLEHWRETLSHHGLIVADPEVLSSRYRLAPGLVERAVAHVASSGPAGDDATSALAEAIRQGRDTRLASLATRVTRLPRWSDVVLPPDVLDSLREMIGRVWHGRRVYEDWGFDTVMTTGRGLTALFDGRPGTGKTMVAGLVARELGLDLYRVDLSRVVSKWIGETEKHLAELFDAVDDGQAIILFDEADSLFSRRTEVKSSNDRYANLEVNYLLQRFDSFEGIAILTTNFGSAIDPAFRRRVSLRLSFPFPDEEAREELWRAHLPAKLPIDGDLDLGALARRFQLAGGYIRNACLRAAFLAAQEEVVLGQRHLERAVQLEFQQVGKISTSGPVE